MAIVVEDGTGLTNADAFISEAYFNAYCDKRGKDYSAYSTTQKEQAIVRATDYLSESYRWQGFKLKERGHADGEQSLAWPRSYVIDRNGYSVASDEVPTEVQKATAEVAFYELANVGAMQPAYVAHDRVKAEKFGPVSFEYDLSNGGADGARPVLLAVRDLIGEFLDKRVSSLAGKAVRV